MSLKWWEKTVEYKFILLVAQEEKLFLAPLDDDQERAGDAIFSTDHRWVLIEFKKDQSTIAREKGKFNNYNLAEKEFNKKDGHHYIIFGFTNSADNSNVGANLEICYQTYFSKKSSNLSEVLSSGINFNEFKEYIEKYTTFKKVAGGDGDGSGGGLNIDDFALVAGVNTDNNVVECLSLTEFRRQFGLDITHESTLNSGYNYDGPSF